jgi:hypothetical protein
MLAMVAMDNKFSPWVCGLNTLVVEIYECFDIETNHLGRLTKFKQSSIVEDFIVSFEQLDFRTEGMSDTFFRECFIIHLKDEICSHVLMARPQSSVGATKRAKEAQQVVSYQTVNPPLFLTQNQ